MLRLLVLHTNDLHGRLRPHQAEELRTLKMAQPNTLLVDAGDAVGSGNLGFYPWGERILERMNTAGYDAMALGNREFHPCRFALRLKIGKARFPLLCANLWARRGSMEEGVRSALLLPLPDGSRVALFGLLREMVREGSWAARFSDFLFREPLATAAEWTQRLRREADWVLCLSHLGWEKDRELAEAVPDLDAIIGGHSHTPLPHPQRIGSVWVVQSAPYGRAVGRLLLERWGDEVRATGELLPL